jgi:uncharacterized protein YcbK (DUF882 family)
MEEPCAAPIGTHLEPENVEESKRFFVKACAIAAGCLLVPEVAAKSRGSARHHGRGSHGLANRQQTVAGRRVHDWYHDRLRVDTSYRTWPQAETRRYSLNSRVRDLAIYNTHTGESFSAPYWAYGAYQPGALRHFSFLMRDHHNNAVHPIDPQLLDLLHRIQTLVGRAGPFHVMSAYRSPETNEQLGRHHRGVAEHSMHLEGKAADLWLPGCGLQDLRRAATALRGGGVGYYPESNFVHIDSGKIRYWES